jgi:hypothetical protein
MKLWLLRPIEKFVSKWGDIRNIENNPWVKTYDMSFGFVICAQSEERARAIAEKNAGLETEKAWIDPKWSTCVELKPEMFEKEEIVMMDFNAG